MVYLIIILYLVLTFGASLIGSAKREDTPEDYFLANRGMGAVVLFFTFIATNFSAFFFLGFAGAGYRIGYSYYVMMAFGTAFAALSFYFIGYKVWQLGKENGYITPPELIGDQSQSKSLRNLYLLVMCFFTLPYLAIQPIGAGYLLEALTDGQIPYFAGATLLTIVIVIYVFIGGMRSVALTDMKQGLLMFILMFAAVFVVADSLGGLSAANQKVYALEPALFSREGLGNYFTPKKWFSMMLLWVLCVPMFPQLFMRFYVSKDLPSFKASTILYSLVPTVLFICPVIIGVLGHISFPDLAELANYKQESDKILPLMLNLHAPAWLAALIMTGALAAFMSTMDSQLLAIGTILTRDFYRPYINDKISLQKEVQIGRIFIILLALIGLLIAYNPPGSIFGIVKQAFTAYAVLFPTTIAILYFKRVPAWACIASILSGELIVCLLFFNLFPKAWLFGFDPIVPIMMVCVGWLIVGGLLAKK